MIFIVSTFIGKISRKHAFGHLQTLTNSNRFSYDIYTWCERRGVIKKKQQQKIHKKTHTIFFDKLACGKIWTNQYNHTTQWNSNTFLRKNRPSFIYVDAFKRFDLILHDIILLNWWSVGHELLPRYLSYDNNYNTIQNDILFQQLIDVMRILHSTTMYLLLSLLYMYYILSCLYLQMRTMMHDNINPFLGACLNTPSPCVLFQYCAKGSLKVCVICSTDT